MFTSEFLLFKHHTYRSKQIKTKKHILCEWVFTALLLIKRASELEQCGQLWQFIGFTFFEFLLHLSELTLLPLPAVKSQVVVKCVHARGLCIPWSRNNFCIAQASRCTLTRLPMDHGTARAHFNTELIKASMLATFEREPTANILHQDTCTESHWSSLYSCSAQNNHFKEKYVLCVFYLWLNHCSLLLLYLQSIFSFIKVARRHFSIPTLF